jgi:hypothetical protein
MVPPAGLGHINGLAGFGPPVLNTAGGWCNLITQKNYKFFITMIFIWFTNYDSLVAGGGNRGANSHQTHEMTVPNEIIGCVIGKGGSKIAEIRWVESTGAC